MEDHKGTINVLLVNDHLGWDGSVMHGVGRLFLHWFPNFNKDRYHVIGLILRKKDALYQNFEKRGIELRFLGKGKFNPLTLLGFVKIIRQEKIDVMHLGGFGACTFGRLASIFTGVPVLVHYHDTSPYYPWIQRAADALLARFTDAALAVSNSVKRFNIEHGRTRGIDPDKIMVMYNCVSLNEIKIPDREEILAQKKHLGIEPDSKVVGTVTRLFETKGNRYLLEAAVEILKVYPKTNFVIVGDGPLRKDLQGLARQLGISDHVIFTGFCENALQVLATFDVKVISSWDAEGTPLVVLEAMAMGKPVVATNIIEIIEDGRTGLIVPTKDSKAIARKVISLLKNKDYAQKLGRNALKESKKYDVHAYVRKLEKIYDDLVLNSKN